jgi:hypothetical protein
MIVGMIQSNYIPWRGTFDIIDDVDLFIFYDDVRYGRGRKWINRNIIKTRGGSQWITVPLKRRHENSLIRDVEIDYSQNWQRDHLNLLYENYHRAPFWKVYIDEFSDLINQRYASISELNITLCKWVMECLDIRTKLSTSNQYLAKGTKQERPLALLLEIGASDYVSGPSAEPYTPLSLFRSNGIGLSFKTYEYDEYPQMWGDFINNATILDLLFNTGQGARAYLKSKVPSRLILVPSKQALETSQRR